MADLLTSLNAVCSTICIATNPSLQAFPVARVLRDFGLKTVIPTTPTVGDGSTFHVLAGWTWPVPELVGTSPLVCTVEMKDGVAVCADPEKSPEVHGVETDDTILACVVVSR